MTSPSIEKPPHADIARIRHVTDEDLLAAIDLELPALGPARRAASREDVSGALDALRVHFARGQRPHPLPSRRHRLDRLTPPEREAVLAGAAEAAERKVSFTDPAAGRSGLYALHYLTWTTSWLDAHLLTGEPRWAETWASTFDDWYQQRDLVVGAWPGLDVIWYTLGVATRTQVCLDALDALAGELPQPTSRRLLAAVLGGCRWLADEHDEFRPGNWQFVGACALLRCAALLPEFQESADWARVAHTRVTEHLALDVYSDGGHLERAPSYHLLCLHHLRDAAAHAKAYLDLDLTGHPSYRRMHDWPIAMSTPEGWIPPFQDSAPVDLASLAAEWDEPIPPTWRPPHTAKPGDDAWNARLHEWLAGSKYVVSRTGWKSGDLYSAINCGPAVPHELESHSHRASLDFVLWGHGTPLAWEAGGPTTYDEPSYYSWYQAAAAHNTVLLDGRTEGDERDSTVELVAHTDSADVVCGHHDGWEQRHRRTFVFVRPDDGMTGYWLVDDSLTGRGTWCWRLHGVAPWQQSAAGAWRSAGDRGLAVHVAGGGVPRSWSTSTGATRVPVGRELRDDVLHTLELRPAGRDISTVLLPFRGEPSWLVEDDPGGSCTVLRCGDVTDVIRDRSWFRRSGSGPVRGVAWLSGSIRDESGALVESPTASLLAARWERGRIAIGIRCAGRASVRIRETGATGVLLGGIRVPFQSQEGVVTIAVPEAGEWQLELHRADRAQDGTDQ